MYFLACIPMILTMNIWTVFIFLIVNEISKALIGVTYFSFMFSSIKDLPKSGLRTESMVMREIMLNIGRLLSITTFILLYLVAKELTIYYFLFAIFIQGLLFKILSAENEGIMVEKRLKSIDQKCRACKTLHFFTFF
jgi:YQGE family putative transporter